MKLFFQILCGLFLSINTLWSQDIIVCKNGDEILSKILKISKSEVEYKKWSNQDGPIFILDKSDVFMIKYQNGEKDVFKDSPADQNIRHEQENDSEINLESNEPIQASPAANNSELIEKYNQNILDSLDDYYASKKKLKKDIYTLGTIGLTSSSIISTDEIEISLLQTKIEQDWRHYTNGIMQQNVGDSPQYNHYVYYHMSYVEENNKFVIMIKNKSTRVIYVDKASCFGSSSLGSIKTFYDAQEYTVTEGGDSGKGASVNLGSVADAFGVGGTVGALASGINVGGEKSKFKSLTTTHKDNQILTIPPGASVALSQDGIKDHPTEKKKVIITGSYEFIDTRDFSTMVSKTAPTKLFNEENSPVTWNYMITYSFNKNLTQCYMTNFGVYIKGLFLIDDAKGSAEAIQKIKAGSPYNIVVGRSGTK